MIKKILAEIVHRVKPDEKIRAEVLSRVSLFLAKLNKNLKKINAVAVLGGSYAKDTWLVGDYDVDVFVVFDKEFEGMSDVLEKSLKAWTPIRLHGSRDYFQVKGDINYEIVPVVKRKKGSVMQNSTDYSVDHVNWVNREGRKVKDDIRLFKKFCKANGVYGAESYVRGISGHVADLLVIKCGGFMKLIKAASKWSGVEKVVLDPKNVHKGKALLVLNTSKTQGPLVLVDPMQPLRNAAAALSAEKFQSLISSSIAFLKAPDLSFFEDKKTDLTALQKRSGKGILIRVSAIPLEGTQDVIGTKLLKVFDFLQDALGAFTIRKCGWNWKGNAPAEFWFLLKKKSLPKKTLVTGPPLRLSEHVTRFQKQHKCFFVKGRKVYAYQNRTATTPNAVLAEELKNEYVTSRVKSCRVVNWNK